MTAIQTALLYLSITHSLSTVGDHGEKFNTACYKQSHDSA